MIKKIKQYLKARKIKIISGSSQYEIEPFVLRCLLAEEKITPKYRCDTEVVRENLGYDLSETAIEEAQGVLNYGSMLST